jgi:hypothetical protein
MAAVDIAWPKKTREFHNLQVFIPQSGTASSRAHRLPKTLGRKRTWVQSALAVTIGCALLAAPLGTAHAADVVITLDRGFLERAVEDAITQTVIAEEPDLHWGHVSGRRVEITRNDDNAINVDLDLAFDVSVVGDPEVDVDIEIGFDCFWADPDVKLAIPRFDVDVSFPWYVNVYTMGLSWVGGYVADIIIDKEIDSMDQVKEEIVHEINEQLGEVGFDVCPAFNVTSDANVEVIFGQGSECTPGEEDHQSCPANHSGPGYDLSCINGYWERTGGQCEPVAPPGGERP